MLSADRLNELQWSSDYADFILDNYDGGERIICNGDTLLQAQEDGYLFAEFLMYRQSQMTLTPYAKETQDGQSQS